MVPRVGRTRRRWSRMSRWSPWTTEPPVSRSLSAGSTACADAADARAPRTALGRRLRAGARPRAERSGPGGRLLHAGHGRGARRSARPRNSTPATTRRIRSSPRPGAPRDQRARDRSGTTPRGWVRRSRAGSGRQRHLGDRGARELALGGRRASDGADPHGRRLPDAGRHLPQRPGRARRPQRQAAVRAHRVGGPGGDGRGTPSTKDPMASCSTATRWAADRSWPSCSARSSRTRCER